MPPTPAIVWGNFEAWQPFWVRCCSCRWRRCKLSLCSPFEPFLQERRALKSKISAISQYWLWTQSMGGLTGCISLGNKAKLALLQWDKSPSKIKCCPEDLLADHARVDHFWKSHAVFCASAFGFVLFFFPPSRAVWLQSPEPPCCRGIHQLLNIHLQELVCALKPVNTDIGFLFLFAAGWKHWTASTVSLVTPLNLLFFKKACRRRADLVWWSVE